MLLTRGERKQRGARKSNPAEIHGSLLAGHSRNRPLTQERRASDFLRTFYAPFNGVS
jgi:hypothetical protein